MTWDDQKVGDYAFQTEFSYRANQVSRKRWIILNVILGKVLGFAMWVVVFLITDTYLSDPLRLAIAFIIGVWPTKFTAITAERTTLAAQVSMAATFGIGILIYALSLLIL